MEIKLSSRMEAVVRLASAGGVVADVGTDHAHIPIALVQRGIASHVIAMEVRKGPRQRAQENIPAAGLADRVETRLSDGVAALAPGEADVIIIAGMGGPLMMRILTDGRAVCHQARELVLQPQSEVAQFRKFLAEERYEILDEDMVCEDGKYYMMMQVTWQDSFYKENESYPANCIHGILTEITVDDVNESQQEKENALETDMLALKASYKYGPMLLQRRHPVLFSYLQKEAEVLADIAAKLPQEDTSPRIAAQRREILDRIACNQYVCSRYFS